MEIKNLDSELELKKESDVQSQKEVTSSTEKQFPKMKEVLSKRGLNSKTYQKKKGLFETKYYSTPIHSYDEALQSFIEPNHTLTETEDGTAFQNERNGFKVMFPKSEGHRNTLFTADRSEHRVTISAKPSFGRTLTLPIPVLEQEGKKVVYSGMTSNTDYTCKTIPNGVKVSMSAKTAEQKERHSFVIAYENLEYRWNPSTTALQFFSKVTDELIFEIPAPFMKDATGTYSEHICFEITQKNENECELTVIPELGWLSAKERVYPVELEWSLNFCIPTDCGIEFDLPSLSADGKVAISGMNIPFKMHMPKKNPNMNTQKTELLLHCDSVPVSEEKEYLLTLNRITEAESDATATSTVIGVTSMNEAQSEYAFDVTSEYAAEENTTYALQLCEMQDGELTATSDSAVALMSISGDEAIATYSVTETDGTTEEDSSSGETGNIGSVGTYEIDLAWGRLNMEMTDFSWEGNRMPVSISRSYRGINASKAYSVINENGVNIFGGMKIGNGWRMNLMQSMVNTGASEDHDGKDTYTYIDESGEEIVFVEVVDEPGVYCTYRDVNDFGYTFNTQTGMLSKGTEKLYFSSGSLIRMVDEFNNELIIHYSQNRIISVVDGVGRTFNFDYDGNKLIRITAPNGSYIQYTYSDNNLESVTYPNGQMIHFNYDDTSYYPTAVTATGNGITERTIYFETDNTSKIIEVGNVVNGTRSGKYTKFSYTKGKQTLVTEYDQESYGSGSNTGIILNKVVFQDYPEKNYSYYEAENTNKISVDYSVGRILPYTDPGMDIGKLKCENLLENHNFSYSITDPDKCGWCTNMSSSVGDISFHSAENMPGFCSAFIHAHSADARAKGLCQTVSLEADQPYVFSCYLRLTRANSNPGHGVYLRINNKNSVEVKRSRMITQSGQFMRLALPFTPIKNEDYTFCICIDGNIAAKAVAPQLEKGTMLSPYNYLSAKFNATYVQVSGYGGTKSTNVYVNSNKDVKEVFTLSGYAQGTTNINAGYCAYLEAKIHYAKNAGESAAPAPEEFSVPIYTKDSEERVFAMLQFSKNRYHNVDHLEITCRNNNSKPFKFYNVQLVRNSYTENLTEEDFTGVNTEVEYEEGSNDAQLQAYRNEAAEDDMETVTFEEALDAFGNALTGTNFKNGELGTIYTAQTFGETSSSDAYTDIGNNKTSEIDARGNETKYEYDSVTSKPTKVTDRCGNETSYTYDASGRTTKVTAANGGTVNYAYNSYDDLTSITRGDGQTYTMSYDAYRNLTSVTVDGQQLVTYAYKDGTNRLKKLEYLNGSTQTLTYDRNGNVTHEVWMNGSATEANYHYSYDASNQLVKTLDILNQKMYNMNRVGENVASIEEYNVTLNGETVTAKTLVGTMHYSFDSDGKQFRKKYVAADGSEQKYVFEYRDEQNVAVQLPTGVVSHSKSDHLGRKVFDELQLGKGLMNRKFTYHEGVITEAHEENDKRVSNPETTLVKQIEFADGRTIQYEYDAEERISSVIDTHIENGEAVTNKTAYTYDALGQLSQEITNAEFDDEGKVIGGNRYGYQYNGYGNIIKKGVRDENGDFTGEVVTYGYDNTTWNDKLTSYNGQSITYDTNGNPTNYMGTTLVWEKGRQLKRFGNFTYKYNNNGIRIQKVEYNRTHDYVLDGTNIVKEIITASEGCIDEIEYLYDLDGTVCGLKHNGTAYYFYKNLQGDVIAITDDAGTVVAHYTYDAWGKVLSVTDANHTSITSATHIANINPFRYRSYYYDTETGLYYLQSRYYNPAVGRFINADNEQSILSEGLGCIGYNIFTYCHNNPINGSDIDGCAFIQVVAKIILGIILGIYIQLVFDILDYLLNLLSDPNATFSASGKNYILSILSSILSFFSFKKRWVRLSIGALQIVFSYLGEPLTKQVWANIITDVMFLFVSEIIGGSLDRENAKKIKKTTKTINKNKKKLSQTLKIAKLNKKKLIIEEKFYALGVGITFSLNISNKLINSVANFFIK